MGRKLSKKEAYDNQTATNESDDVKEELQTPDASNVAKPSEDSSDVTKTAGEVKNVESTSDKSLSVTKILAAVTVFVLLVAMLIINSYGTNDVESVEKNSPYFLWAVIVGSLLVAAISTAMSFWLYYVRALVLKDGPALVPEKWGALLARLSYDTKKSRESIVGEIKHVLDGSQKQQNRVEELFESFLTLQQAISARDEEINRLKQGHDSKVFKRFLIRFIKVGVAITEVKNNTKDAEQLKNLTYVDRLIKNALEECGLVEIMPELAKDYRDFGLEVADGPNIIETDDENLNFKIASVQSPTYAIEGEGQNTVIIPSRVTIYKYSDDKGVQ